MFLVQLGHEKSVSSESEIWPSLFFLPPSSLFLLSGAVGRIGLGTKSNPMLIPGFLGFVLSITIDRDLSSGGMLEKT